MTHYDILGVSKNATQEEIRKAYIVLVKKYHPDLYKGDKSYADKKTKEINNAYDVLSDEEARKKYDEEIAEQSGSYSYTEPTYTDNSGAKNIYEEVLRNYRKRYNEYFDSRNNASNSYGSYQSRNSASGTKKKSYSYENYEKINKLYEEWDVGAGLKIGIVIGIILLLAVFIFLNSYLKALRYTSEISNKYHVVVPKTEMELENDRKRNEIYARAFEEQICILYDAYTDEYGVNDIDDVTDIISEDAARKIYKEYYSDRYSYEQYIDHLNDILEKHIEDRENNKTVDDE